MPYDNPTLHNGFLISGRGEQHYSGRWQCHLLIERPGFVAEGMAVVPLCDGALEAEQQAIAAGREMVDSPGFGLLPAD
jgi:hypothetical protein